MRGTPKLGSNAKARIEFRGECTLTASSIIDEFANVPIKEDPYALCVLRGDRVGCSQDQSTRIQRSKKRGLVTKHQTIAPQQVISRGVWSSTIHHRGQPLYSSTSYGTAIPLL